MIDDNGNICDCARSSLFVRYDRILYTCNNKSFGIHGVTKKIIEENEKPEGYGLGLALTKRQIESIGGSIRAVHNLPCGLRFIIDLPVE